MSSLHSEGTGLWVLGALALCVHGFSTTAASALPFILALAVSGIGYVATILTYPITALAVARRRFVIPAIGLVAGAGSGLGLAGFDLPLTNWLALAIPLLAGGFLGRGLGRSEGRLRLFLTGAAVTTALALIQWGPMWPELDKAFAASLQQWLDQSRQTMLSLGYGAEAVSDNISRVGRTMTALGRLVPAATVLAVITQYCLGYFALSRLVAEPGEPNRLLAPFTRWRVPFRAMPPVIVALLARVVGGGDLARATENLIFAAAVFYCVGGLSLLEFALRTYRTPLFVRIVIYVALVLSGFLGFAIAALAGFIDSYTDWRRLEKIALERT